MKKQFVIDRDEEFIRAIKGFCIKEKVNTRSFSQAKQVLSAIESDVPDLIFLNIDGDDVNEFIAHDILKKCSTDFSIPVLITYSEAKSKDIKKYKMIRFKAKAFLQKPIEEQKLQEILQEYLGAECLDTNAELSGDIFVEEIEEESGLVTPVESEGGNTGETDSLFDDLLTEENLIEEEPKEKKKTAAKKTREQDQAPVEQILEELGSQGQKKRNKIEDLDTSVYSGKSREGNSQDWQNQLNQIQTELTEKMDVRFASLLDMVEQIKSESSTRTDMNMGAETENLKQLYDGLAGLHGEYNIIKEDITNSKQLERSQNDAIFQIQKDMETIASQLQTNISELNQIKDAYIKKDKIEELILKLENEQLSLHNTVEQVKVSVELISSEFDGFKDRISEVKTEMTTLTNEILNIRQEMDSVKKVNSEKESVLFSTIDMQKKDREKLMKEMAALKTAQEKIESFLGNAASLFSGKPK